MKIQTWKIIDFKYGIKSVWDQVLKFCVDHSSVRLVLPGESLTMIS